jgi:hypothetical protein
MQGIHTTTSSARIERTPGTTRQGGLVMQEQLSGRPDLEWYRKQAKALVRAYRARSPEAVERVEARLGPRARTRFRLGDAQWLLAREHGFRTWAALRDTAARDDSPVERWVRPALAAVAQARDGRAHVALDSGLRYGGGDPVVVDVRRRPRGRGAWLDFGDGARGVDAANRPPGWGEVARRVVDELDLNLNRRGVVFVSAPESSGDARLDAIALRVGDASLAVYEALLELDE